MSHRSTLLIVILAPLLLNLPAASIRAQSHQEGKTAALITIPDRNKNAPNSSGIPNPVTVFPISGKPINGLLLGPDPLDTDAVIVEVDGIPLSIKLNEVREIRSIPRLFDEFGRIARNDLKARLDNFVVQLNQDPGSQGYIIAYGDNCQARNEAQNHIDYARDYLINSRSLDASQVSGKDGGFRDSFLFQLYILNPGEAKPEPKPTKSCP